MSASIRVCVAATVIAAACALAAPPAVYQDPSAPLERRVDDLLGRMTIEEKVGQLMNDSPAIDRLGVPAYNWWNECLHGVARAGRATVFPEAIGLAATWDPKFHFRVAQAISDEARAKYNEFVRRGKRNIYQGLTFWTPNINLFRDPRWGRGMETYGEDPYLTGRMATEFIRGLQGDDPKYLKTIATAKHYAVHSGPESERHTFDARISDRDLLDTYLPQFEMAVKDGGALSVMCAYNRVDGAAACASSRLLTDILRSAWHFPGYVVSDCGAIGDIYLHHKVEKSAEAGVALAVKSGCDLNCGVEYAHLLPAVKQGLIREAEIDVALRRLLTARFRLGMFDPPAMVPYANIPYSVNDSAEHKALALEAARKSIVLLKNEAGILPLSKSIKTIAVIGPNADDVDTLLGNYNGEPSAPVTPLQGLRRKLPDAKIIYAAGSDFAENMPRLTTVPSSALFTSRGNDRKPGLTGLYIDTANFTGKAMRPRELTYPNSGKLVGAVPPATKPVFTRVDPQIDFHWGSGSPQSGLDSDNFGVRWGGYLRAPVTGTYQLGGNGFNSFEIYLDEKLVASRDNIHERGYAYGPVTLEAGKLYSIRVDFHHFLNDADMQLVWAPPVAGDESREAIAAARQADAVVLFLGLSPRLEGEEMKVPVAGFSGGDRVSIGLPKLQQSLLERVVAVGKPTVLVLMNGSALSVNWARDHVPAIVEAWYPGQAGGEAIADVLMGDYNPAGRLPVTFYQSVNDLPAFTNYDMKGRTYRYFEGDPLFPFGFGLSYTSFAYGKLQMPSTADTSGEVKVSVEVTNTGKRAGEEVVQLYLKHLGAVGVAPIRSLKGVERVSLRPGESRTIEFTLKSRELSSISAAGERVVAPGKIEISVGGKQPGFRGLADAATTSTISGLLTLEGAVTQVN